jgi:hypothetical protein
MLIICCCKHIINSNDPIIKHILSFECFCYGFKSMISNNYVLITHYLLPLFSILWI